MAFHQGVRMPKVRPRASDILLLLLGAYVVIATIIGMGVQVRAILRADDLTAPMAGLLIGLPLTWIFLKWVGWGAWRRTVWGCRMPAELAGCPRHGTRCVTALGTPA